MSVREIIREHDPFWWLAFEQDKKSMLSSQLQDHLSGILIDPLWRYLDLLEAQLHEDAKPMEET